MRRTPTADGCKPFELSKIQAQGVGAPIRHARPAKRRDALLLLYDGTKRPW